MTTSTAAGLLAKAVTDSGDFSHHTGLNGGQTADASLGSFELQPASLDFGASAITKYYTATATNEGNYAAADSTIVAHDITASNSAAQTSGVYAERIYLKTTGTNNTATVTKATVTMTTTSDTLAAAVRCTLLDKNNAVIATWGANGNTYAHDTSGALAFTTGSTKYSVQTGTKTGLNIAVNGNGTANWVTAIIWLDGEDTTVATTNVTNAAELLSKVMISFEL